MRSLAILTLAMTITSAAHAAAPEPADHQQLTQLAQQMDRAWTAGDAEANALLFASDATARFGNDPLGLGRNAILAQFQSFFKDRPAGLRHVTKIERVEQLSPDLAIWDAEVRVERHQPGGQWATVTRIRNFAVVIRQPDGWRIKIVRAFPVGN